MPSNSITVAAVPAPGAAFAADPFAPFRLDVPAVLREAQGIIDAATSDPYDRNLLTAARMLRNAVTELPSSTALWAKGASVFDAARALDRQAGRASTPPEPTAKFPSIAEPMASAERKMAQGNVEGALADYATAMVDGAEHEPLWRAGLLAAQVKDGAKRNPFLGHVPSTRGQRGALAQPRAKGLPSIVAVRAS